MASALLVRSGEMRRDEDPIDGFVEFVSDPPPAAATDRKFSCGESCSSVTICSDSKNECFRIASAKAGMSLYSHA